MNRPDSPGRQIGVTAASFLLAAVVGALLWHQLVDLPAYTRTADNGSMDALQLSRSVGIDAWYSVIGGVLALGLGVGLTLWAALAPRRNVLTLLACASVAGWLMLRVGKWLGPGDVEARLATARIGDQVPVELVPSSTVVDILGFQAHAILLVWPIAALAGAALVLVFSPLPTEAHAAR